MKSFSLLFIYVIALLTCPLLCGTSSSRDDRRWLISLIDLVELDYVDQCEQRASAAWSELIGEDKGLAIKLERDKAFGLFVRQQTTDVKSALTAHALSPEDNVLRRKVKLLMQPGDSMLDTEQWIRLVTFGDTALHKIRFSTNYDCGTQTNCTLRGVKRADRVRVDVPDFATEATKLNANFSFNYTYFKMSPNKLHYNLARQQDEEILRRMKSSWEENLPSIDVYLEQILPLLRNATKYNNYNSIEEYWDALGEYEGGIIKARELWDSVRPLYLKLQKYVSLRLRGSEFVGTPLPVHILRSLIGDDWSNLIESLLPKHAGIYQKVHANLQLKELGGLKTFKEAEKLISSLNLGEIDQEFWSESVFNSTCPTVLVDWCKPNKLRAITCKDVSIGNYVEAHDALMKIKYKETINLHSNNTYLLRDASRYSAIYEAVPGFVSLLSLNPHALSQAGLFPLEVFNYNPNHHRLVLQLILALRDLPKLNFYMAADEWRLRVLMGKIPYPQIRNSWSEFRKNFSMIESSNVDLLGDPYIVFNKPYIGKFMGIILKYQIYQSFAEELASDDSDLIKHVAENNERLVETMMQGYGSFWPEMVSDLLAKRENGLEYTGLTDYYRLLDEYLDNQLDPSTEKEESDDYVEPVIPDPIPEINEIPDEKPGKEVVETHENLLENEIDVGDDGTKLGIETSTVGVLEIKNPVPPKDKKEEENPKEASYNTYWWLAIAAAIIVLVVLVGIIARKRHSHRKQLQRQRQNNRQA